MARYSSERHRDALKLCNYHEHADEKEEAACEKRGEVIAADGNPPKKFLGAYVVEPEEDESDEDMGFGLFD